MKNHITILFLVGILILVSSCRKDDFFEEPGTNPIPTDIPTSIIGDLTGLVFDNNQQAIAHAVVELGGLTTTTDENGVFNFENAIALSTGSLVSISKEGYYEGFKFTRFKPGKNSILKIQMVKKNVISTFQSTNQASIDVNGAHLDLPANITTRPDGTPYNGLVNVEAFWYDPTDENTIQNMPGDLRGINEEGMERQLTTFGMMVVEISDESGQKLVLKEGMKATLTFPLPPNANGPDQIPMWHLDEESGVWLEEGLATKVGSAMVAKVSHFSFWNCDVPFDLVNLEGRIISGPEENPVGGLEVVITDNTQMISGYGYTNNEGVFSGKVPSGNDLTISIFNCGTLTTISDIGILTMDTDLGDVKLERANQLNVTASIVGCSGEIIENGYALISTGSAVDLVVSNNGQINHILFPCQGEEGTFKALNFSNATASEELTFNLEGAFINLGTVEVCNGEDFQSISFSYEGAPVVTFSDALVSIVDETFLHIHADDGTASITLRYYLDGAPRLELADNHISLTGLMGEVSGISFSDDDDDDWNNVSGLEIGDAVFGFLEDHPTEDLTISYNLTIDQIVTTPEVTGYIWLDYNSDGIRDENEGVPTTDVFNLWSVFAAESGMTSPNFFFNFYSNFKFDSDGAYSIRGMIPDKEYFLSFIHWSDPAKYQATEYQQGSDPTIDSDYILDPDNCIEPLSSSCIKTLPFTLEEGEVLSNIGLGLVQ